MTKEFKIHQLFLTNNDCYKRGKKQKVKGIMWHSTGANNPKLSRYIGPDDGILGVNPNGNHWNQPKPDGRSVCVHAFIGKDKNGIVRTYQTLPWNYVGWHSGYGSKGSANTLGYIGFEICEDGLNNKKYFDEVYHQAIELSVFLCKKYNLTEKDIISHSEGHKKGIASNHDDVEYWFSKFDKTMNDIRKDVALELKGDEIMTKLEKWQEEMGKKSIESLSKKKDDKGNLIVDSPSNWRKTLGEDTPQWLFWSIIDRITN